MSTKTTGLAEVAETLNRALRDDPLPAILVLLKKNEATMARIEALLDTLASRQFTVQVRRTEDDQLIADVSWK